MVKYSAQPLTAIYEIEETKLTFKVPNEKDLLAFGAHLHAVVGDALSYDAVDKKHVVLYSKMDPAQLEKFFRNEIEFLAARLVSVENLDSDEDPATWGIDQKINFLSWLDDTQPTFADFARKFTAPQKKT